jgi:hypothetical protein
MRKAVCGALGAVLLLPALAAAQVRAGAEFQVNTYTTGYQFLPVVGMDKGGNFVIVWGGEQPGSSTDALAQRYTPAGARLGGEFRVNTYTTGFQTYLDLGGLNLPPSVARNARGAFVVVWSSAPGPVHPFDVVGQRFDAAGAPRGAEFVVTDAGGYNADVAIAPSGAFVVTFNAYDGGGGDAIFARRYDPSGAPIGAQFQVNTYTTGFQAYSQVAVAPDGAFVVVWSDFNLDGSLGGVFGQRFSAAGTRLGVQFQVNTYTTDEQVSAQVATDASGNFVVVWHSFFQFNDTDVVGRRYDAAGNAVGGEFLVNSYTVGDQRYAHVAVNGPGDFLVTWFGEGTGDPDLGIFARRYDAGGAPREAEFMVNSYTTSYQAVSRLATDGAGNFAVTWISVPSQDGSGLGVFAQRYGGLFPAALEADLPGNDVLEPGESVIVSPAWRNLNGASQTFTGTLTALTGPPGATYTITDAAGGYGTVANGATQACLDCYGVSVSNPPARPATHWDATATEAISPAAQGQVKLWALHVGDSFTDAPRSSPFYRFIEILLHRGITGGCSATAYCPASSTTREQMAVFLLAAKEGAGFLPSACATPMFGDVPASSPFCRFIEELARRGVTGGCGGGNYCPNAAVTREQMAVFLLRTLDPNLNPPNCGTPVFADVPASSPFCRWIEELARRGITGGCGGGNYCPAAEVTREQMAVFLTGTFSLTLYGP